MLATKYRSDFIYYIFGNIRGFNFREFREEDKYANSRISRIYYYNSATKDKWKFASSKLRKKAQNQKFANI